MLTLFYLGFIFVLILSYLFVSIYLKRMLPQTARKEDVTKQLREFSRHIILQNGHSLLLRAINPNDKQRLADAFHRLTGKSIYFRFFSSKRKLSKKELNYFTEIDFEHHIAIVATIIHDEEEEIVGVGRYIELKEKAPEKVAEIAFAVDDEHQHLGIGTILFEHIVTIAQKNGISRLNADVLLENKNMLKVFKHSGFKPNIIIDHGVMHIKFNIADQELSRYDEE